MAVEVGHELQGGFENTVRFIDFGLLNDPRLVQDTVAAALGPAAHSSNLATDLNPHLRDRRILLIFDSCEHVVEHVAELAERILRQSPHVKILATSRESLRAEGEWLYRLLPLEFPPANASMGVSELTAYPAAQLFVERATAGSLTFALTDADAAHVAEICLKLDGIPLAIELAAGRVNSYGIPGVAMFLKRRLELLWQGRRTAPSRHRTLSAMLDWSNNLLPPVEALILRRLSVFTGSFSIEAAQAIASGDGADSAQILEAVASLVTKSLIALDDDASSISHRLLDTTRDYYFDKLLESGEADAVALAHVRYFKVLLDRTFSETSPTAEDFTSFGKNLGNIRAALEWSFSDRGNLTVGVSLAASAAHFFLERSLMSDCLLWVRRSFAARIDTAVEVHDRIELFAALGTSLLFTQGGMQEVREAFEAGLALAETVHAPKHQLRLLSGYFLFLTLTRNFRLSLKIAQRCKAIAAQDGDHASRMMAEWMIGVARHTLGDQVGARAHCELAVKQGSPWRWVNNLVRSVGQDYRISALIVLARAHWILGNPDRAVSVARYSIKEAELLELPLMICSSLLYAGQLFLWTGDWASADEAISRTIKLAKRHSFGPLQAHGTWLKGVLAIKRGQLETGLAGIRSSMDLSAAQGYPLVDTTLYGALAEGLALTGDLEEAQAAIEQAISRVEAPDEEFDMPELLRIKGNILKELHPRDPSQAEECLLQSLAYARQKHALGWELRSAVDLARLWSRCNRLDDARALLAPVYARFTEGFDNIDLTEAKRVLTELNADIAPD